MIFAKIDGDVERFNKIVKGKVRKDLKKFMSDGHIIGRQGKKNIRVPLPGIDIPHFTFGGKDKGGTGMGDGENGDPMPGKGKKGPGKGQEGGKDDGEHPYAEFTPDELAQMLGEELQLPNIENKGRKSTNTIKDRYSKIQNEGPQGLRHMKRTYREALKRTMGSGEFDPDNPYVIPIKPDFRYKAPKTIVQPEVSVVVHYLRDYSGSITTEMCQQIKSSVFWIDLWLEHQYKKKESRYYVHDTVCEELDHDKFFEVADGGGTKVSSGYKKVFEAMQENPDANHYLFQWSDGDNQGGDWTACAELLNANILPIVNLFGYGQVREAHGGDLYHDLTENIKSEKFVAAITLTGEDILKTMKTFLGTGK